MSIRKSPSGAVAVILLVLASCILAGCAVPKNVLYQTATIDSLASGAMDGGVTVRELARHGDTGLGTVDGLDGEMVVVEGVFYRVAHDGSVTVIDPDTRTPFAMVVFFKPDREAAIPPGSDLSAMVEALETALPTKNLFFAVRLTGTFEHLKARSVPAQTRPYPPLAKAVAEQSVFDLGRVRGTMVGFRCPKNVGGLNVPGWHFHFISEKDPAGKRSGGHVLAARAGEVMARVADLRRVELVLPRGGDFDAAPEAGKGPGGRVAGE